MSDEWQSVRLAEHVDIAIGGTPSRSMPALWADKPAGHPWLAISDLRAKYIGDTREHISDLGVRSSNVKLIPAGSTVMSFKLSVGRTAITVQLMYSNEAIAAFLPRSDSVDSTWLYHALPRSSGTVVTDSAVKGVTLNKSKMAEMTVLLPSAAEQQVVARVLDTLDTTIRQTEAIIDKLKQVKQGLLHNLLTRGIDDNGELRPPQNEAPHLYKESALGWIPKTWGVERLPNIAIGGLMNGVFKEPKRVGSGVALVNVADLYRGQNVDLDRCERFAATSIERARFGVARGDIFFTRSSLKLEGIAQTSFVDDEPHDAVFECHVIRLRPNPALAVPRFLKEWCVAASARSHFMSYAKQVTMTTISQDGINSLQCPVPPLGEQVEAVRRITALDSRVKAEQETRDKSKALKSGLMDDLLTGRVRVTPLLEDVSP